jgi:hypothetical protein
MSAKSSKLNGKSQDRMRTSAGDLDGDKQNQFAIKLVKYVAESMYHKFKNEFDSEDDKAALNRIKVGDI